MSKPNKCNQCASFFLKRKLWYIFQTQINAYDVLFMACTPGSPWLAQLDFTIMDTDSEVPREES
jgi:hypothetical protein